MTGTLHNFTAVPELRPYAKVIADVAAEARTLGIDVLIAGAFARDLHLHYAYRIPVARVTEDIDFGLAVPDWQSFSTLRARLATHRGFAPIGNVQQKMRHPSGLPVDFVPFSGVENSRREIHWPPDGAEVMTVLGFREALASAVDVILPGDVNVSVVSVPALVLMKFVAWQDRHYKQPRKDAQDLALLIKHYLDMGNEERLWSEFPAWVDEPDFDLLRLGPRMLGIDIARQAGDEARAHLTRMLHEHAIPEEPSMLAFEMSPHAPERASRMLAGILEGLDELRRQR